MIALTLPRANSYLRRLATIRTEDYYRYPMTARFTGNSLSLEDLAAGQVRQSERVSQFLESLQNEVPNLGALNRGSFAESFSAVSPPHGLTAHLLASVFRRSEYVPPFVSNNVSLFGSAADMSHFNSVSGRVTGKSIIQRLWPNSGDAE